jgi:DNA-binding XRE family transcriptional regulator
LKWVRETLDLTQAEMASVLGAAAPTIRAVESGRLKLSAKFAARLAAQTGLEEEQLMRNELGVPLPSPAAVRMRFIRAQKGDAGGTFSPGGRVAELLPHALLLRSFVLQGLIADELGPAGCLHTGFYDALQKMNARLLGKIPNSKLRHRVFQCSRDMGNEEMLEYARRAAEAIKETTAAVRSRAKKKQA